MKNGKFEVNLVYTLNFKTSQGHVAISYFSQQNETKTKQQSNSSETKFLLIFEVDYQKPIALDCVLKHDLDDSF